MQHNPFFISIALFVAGSATAKTQMEIDYAISSFQAKKMISGTVSVSVGYDKQENIDGESNNIHYQMFYNGTFQVISSAFTSVSGGISLKDLNSDGTAEVIIRTFSGGAHCCTNFTIYTKQNNQFIKAETGLLDGEGGAFQDLNGDGKSEFVTNDKSFLYTFSSYAGSFPPSLIYAFRNGRANASCQ